MGIEFKKLFEKKVQIPKEFQCVSSNADVDTILSEQSDLIYGIANFINVRSWTAGVLSFSIVPVNGTKRLINIVRRFGNDNLDIRRRPFQQEQNRRRMEVDYHLLVYFQNSLFRIEMTTYVDAVSSSRKMTSIYDGQLQDLNNIICMGYLRKNYPFIHSLFAQCIEVPVLETFRNRIRKVIQYRINEIPQYHRNGGFLVHEDTMILDTTENCPIGELIGTKVVREQP